MPNTDYKKEAGYTLIEMVLVLVVISVLAAVAMKNLGQVDNISKTEETKLGMDRLAIALVGNSDLVVDGKRVDFGYIGDIGALPASWDDLVNNPGGYATWRGPYIQDQFSETGTNSNFKIDGWGKPFSVPGGNSFQSSGGPDLITRQISSNVSKLLYNRVKLTVTDLNFVPPGLNNYDSVNIVLRYPNGSGGTTARTINPSPNGSAVFDSIPVGNHLLQTIFLQTNDTLIQRVNIDPGRDYYGEIQYYASIWSASGGGGGSGTEILRPNGIGSSSENSTENCGVGWQCVDEITSDGDGSFTKGSGGSWDNDSYATENHTIGSGTIDSIVVTIRSRKERSRTAIRTGGALYEGSDIWLTSSYANYSTTYTANPNTSSAWSWAEIDALEIGVTTKKESFCTQVWVEVFYTY